ncbi:related to Yippee protein [Serendipita indica DSM 11827]|uniref:Protein yippee-like n=1 Tax=Serendipita indica (strain DSM 11827) TaxID=1109443 RepID=G4TSF0_SERID|nr:related to Yippee protein [Serendipita indica DSM 11827]
MGMTHLEFLYGTRIFGCKTCNAHFSTTEDMMSRAFNGQYGRAYLFAKVVNVRQGEPNDRPMTTGLHTVRDIFCIKCNTQVGWKYDKAYDEAQKYKEGKFILEREMIKTVD